MTAVTLAWILVGLYVLGFLWDLLDPDAIRIEFGHPLRAVLSLVIAGFLIAFISVALALSTATTVAVVLGLLAAAAFQAALK